MQVWDIHQRVQPGLDVAWGIGCPCMPSAGVDMRRWMRYTNVQGIDPWLSVSMWV